MGQPLEVHIRKLQDFYWSDADPDGRGFVPLADALRKDGDLREARRLLREGLGRHPDFPSAHVVAGWLSADQEEWEEAGNSFNRALELDPKNIEALRGLSRVLLDRGEIGPALGLLETLSREDPTDLNLPDRILGLKTQIQAPDEAVAVQAPDPVPPIWDDPDKVADELSLESATLQPDSSPAGSEVTVEAPRPWASVVEDGEPIPAQDDLDDALVTSTLGEIYLRQGLFGRAEAVFESLLDGDPENEHLQHRLEEVRKLLQAQKVKPEGLRGKLPTQEEGAPDLHLAPGEVEEELEEEPWGGVVPVEALAPEDPLSGSGVSGVEVVPIEALAPDRVEASAPTGPDPVEVLPIEALAPAEPIPIEVLSPAEIVSIDFLAPDGPVSMDSLAPDGPVSIESLAPDEPVSIQALAPDHPNEPASGGSEAMDDPGRDPTIDAFENWLENLQ